MCSNFLIFDFLRVNLVLKGKRKRVLFSFQKNQLPVMNRVLQIELTAGYYCCTCFFHERVTDLCRSFMLHSVFTHLFI